MNNERTIVFCFRATPPKKHTKSELAKMTKAELIKKVMMMENVRNDWREGIIELQDILHDTERQLNDTSAALWQQTKNLVKEQSKRESTSGSLQYTTERTTPSRINPQDDWIV